ncbi:hypothetical protein NA56DRAFT_704919 [Hyaloscypha hepaticicola]|uniref:Uncharacterized protein n=1 Tax=Hyaloscypha hepaticicola TaxID=2082293 RepID=A0A2J6Q1H1_9HELO|nr:hypothetical protein NA56DRAFT_704919 [Hyaloscypha hepaticicola]
MSESTNRLLLLSRLPVEAATRRLLTSLCIPFCSPQKQPNQNQGSSILGGPWSEKLPRCSGAKKPAAITQPSAACTDGQDNTDFTSTSTSSSTSTLTLTLYRIVSISVPKLRSKAKAILNPRPERLSPEQTLQGQASAPIEEQSAGQLLHAPSELVVERHLPQSPTSA